MVISRLDYCNSIFAGLPKTEAERLQRVQNCAARLIMKKKKHDHVTPTLYELHWLPVNYRWQFKICTLAYRHFDGSLPVYLSDALRTYEPTRSLRSSNEKRLMMKTCNLKTAGEHSFDHTAPKLWNSLPVSLREASTLNAFKTKLKTCLFCKAFSWFFFFLFLWMLRDQFNFTFPSMILGWFCTFPCVTGCFVLFMSYWLWPALWGWLLWIGALEKISIIFIIIICIW